MSSNAGTEELSIPARPESASKVDVKELLEMSVRGLEPMFDSSNQQFCHRLVRTANGFVREGLSPRYTAMTLLGLNELEKFHGSKPFAMGPMLDKILGLSDWPAGAGDFGVLLWATAALAAEKLPLIFERFNSNNTLESYADVTQRRTMELAWLLIGLCDSIAAKQAKVPELRNLATNVYKTLIQNQGQGGYFGHLHASSSGTGRLRGWLGSFADQVYPIIALTRFGQTFDSQESLDRALECGQGVCRAQGPLGQWWWHYDSRTGKVASMYPVFSVHQEGMAPMALFPLGEATGRDFRQNIYRGLEWIGGANEIGVDMRESNVVWRRIHPVPESSMKIDVAMSHLRLYRDASNRKMEILYECRPYELGWLLYAFAGHAEEGSNR
jgi:hypothetical protein